MASKYEHISTGGGYKVKNDGVETTVIKQNGDLKDNMVTSQMISTDVIQYTTVSISIAEMKACRATPKTLIAAPGAGKVLEYLGGLFIYDYAAVYTESSDNLEVRYTNGSGALTVTALETTGLLDATSDQVRTWNKLSTDITPVANAPLVLFNNGDGEFGGTGSPCRMKIAYRVHATGL